MQKKHVPPRLLSCNRVLFFSQPLLAALGVEPNKYTDTYNRAYKKNQ